MFRRILPTLLILAALLMDTSVLPVVAQSWATPLVLLPTVIVFGLLLGRTRGLMYGMIAGVLLDILVAYPMGLMSFSYMAAGYLAGIAGRRFQRYMLTVVLTPVILLAMFEMIMGLYQYIASAEISLVNLRNALVRIAIETVLSQCMYLFYNRLLKPRWSRYAIR